MGNSINIYLTNELHFVDQLIQLVRIWLGGSFILAGLCKDSFVLSKMFWESSNKVIVWRKWYYMLPNVFRPSLSFSRPSHIPLNWGSDALPYSKGDQHSFKSQWLLKGMGQGWGGPTKFKNIGGLFGCHEDWGCYLPFLDGAKDAKCLKSWWGFCTTEYCPDCQSFRCWESWKEMQKSFLRAKDEGIH